MAIQAVSSSADTGIVVPAPRAPEQNAGQSTASLVSPPTHEQIRRAVQDIQRAVDPAAHNLQFSIDKESGKTVIRVVDDATNEVIRQIPSEEIMALSHALDRMAGLLLQEKA